MLEYTFFYYFSLINSKRLHLWNFLTGCSGTLERQRSVKVGSHGLSNSGVSPTACMETLISTSASLICYPRVGTVIQQCLSDQPIQQMCCTQPCAYSLRGRRDSNCFTLYLLELGHNGKVQGVLVGLLVVFFHVFYFFLYTQGKNLVPFRPVDL